jgi:hypothetical protein
MGYPLPPAQEVMMETCCDFADELGPAMVLHVDEPVIQRQDILVVNRCTRGPSIGKRCMVVARRRHSLLSSAPGWV